MKPRNAQHAADQARRLLKPALTRIGPVATREHNARASTMACAIFERWHVGPYSWKAKHLRWFLTYVGGIQAPSTRYRFWLTVRRLLVALDRERDWAPHLRGSWAGLRALSLHFGIPPGQRSRGRVGRAQVARKVRAAASAPGL
jgi:hypothetical protein